MPKNKSKEYKASQPIENHETAAWANIDQLKAESRVPIPNETEVINAKKWVDANRK